MAVMTTQQPEGVAVEQKIQPVPSSDKMALDLDINGQTPRDETNFDSTSPDPAALNKPVETTPSPSIDSAVNVSKAVAVNGAANDDAFAANQAIPTPPIDSINPDLAQVDKEAPQPSPSAPLSSQLPDANTTTIEVAKLSTSPEIQQPEPSTLLASVSADSAVEAALEDIAAVSTVPPVVGSQESDLRHTSPIPSDSLPLDAAQNLTLDSSQDLFHDSNEEPVIAAVETATGDLSFDNPMNVIPQDNQLDQPEPQNTDDLNMILDTPVAPEPMADADLSATANDLAQPAPADTPMIDALLPSQSSNKRDAAEDEDQPPAKRTKTEEADGSDAGRSFASALQNGASPAPATNGQPKEVTEPMTLYLIKEYVKILKNASRTTSGKNFKAPVVALWPQLAESYNAKITTPTDLSTMESNLKSHKYATIQDFKADVHLLHTNAVEFNGVSHPITNSARELRDSIFEKIRRVGPEPTPAVKKEKKPKKSTPVAEAAPRPPPPRRMSKGSGQSSGQGFPSQAQTFALDPSTNTPLIRRDSTKNDSGRFPKREIHPPKPKDLPYSAAKPKSRKFATELRFCEETLTELKKARNSHVNSIFLEPVDPVALNIPTYFDIIRHPMDLSTVTKKLHAGSYANAKDFEKDVRLIAANCCKFNPVDNPVHHMGKQFEALFDSLWANKNQWISEHSPAIHSPSPTVESEEEESDDDDEQDEQPSTVGSVAAARLIEEQTKLINMMSAGKKGKNQEQMITLQQQMVEMLQKTVESEKAQAAAKKPKKAKAPKPKKVAPPPKKEKPTAKKPAKKQSQKYMGTIEKEIISDGLGLLPEDISGAVLDLIREDQGGIDVGDDGTLELDIDVISTPVLWRIHAMIMEHAPEVEGTVRARFAEKEGPRALAKPPPKKKNKPMSKFEQEKNIQHLKNELKSFNQPSTRPGSEEVMQTVEKPEEESSGDESSDSEEE